MVMLRFGPRNTKNDTHDEGSDTDSLEKKNEDGGAMTEDGPLDRFVKDKKAQANPPSYYGTFNSGDDSPTEGSNTGRNLTAAERLYRQNAAVRRRRERVEGSSRPTLSAEV